MSARGPDTRAWTVVSSRLVLDGAPWLSVWAERIRLPSGREFEPFYRYRKNNFSEVFAVTEDQKVLIQRRYRHGPRAMTLDLPAGYVEDGEDPADAARRELREETGYEADAWTDLGGYHTDGNSGGSVAYLYLATGARRVADPIPDDTEEAELMLLSIPDVHQALREGRFATLGAAATASRALLELATTGRHAGQARQG